MSKLKVANYKDSESGSKNFSYEIDNSEEKTLVGVDVFVDIHAKSAEEVAKKVNILYAGKMVMKTISSKGLKVWPRDDEYMLESDHWCCRFMPDSGTITHTDISSLLEKFVDAEIDFVKVENLYNFDGKRGYSLAQGE